MNALSQVCEPHLMNGLNYGDEKAVSHDLIKALTDTMPKFNDTYVGCKWRNNDTICHNLFTKIVSEEGLCYSFNSLNPSEVFRPEG